MNLKLQYIKIKLKCGFMITKNEFKYMNDAYIKRLNSIGVQCGNGCAFYDQLNGFDLSRPWLLSIGEYCRFTKGVIILTHDYSRSVIRKKYGPIIGEARKTVIGDNVFVGMNSIILMGSKVGNNVIIGAGSVVHGNIPNNVVVAGNPARVICTLDQYFQKRKALYIDEAKECVREYRNCYGRNPTICEMGCFFPLYLKRDIEELNNNNICTALNGDNQEEIIEYFLNSVQVYDGYEAFLDEC